jgi:hypothetical protein
MTAIVAAWSGLSVASSSSSSPPPQAERIKVSIASTLNQRTVAPFRESVGTSRIVCVSRHHCYNVSAGIPDALPVTAIVGSRSGLYLASSK